MGFGIFDEKVAVTNYEQILAADGTGEVFWVDNTPQTSRVDAIYVVNEDALDHVITLSVNHGGNYFPFGSATIPANTGFGGTKSMDLLAEVLPVGAVGLVLDAFTPLTVRLAVAMTGTTRITGILQSAYM
jgi:hypothetical protein